MKQGGAAAIPLSGFPEIDIHNMTRTQAIAAIDARLRRVDASVYRLRVIHGFHGGTVLRDAVRSYRSVLQTLWERERVGRFGKIALKHV